jgi:hypothetical protein
VAGDYLPYSYDGDRDTPFFTDVDEGFRWRLKPDGSFDYRLNPTDTARTRPGRYELEAGEGGCVNIRLWLTERPELGDAVGFVCGDTFTQVIMDRGERHEAATVRRR